MKTLLFLAAISAGLLASPAVRADDTQITQWIAQLHAPDDQQRHAAVDALAGQADAALPRLRSKLGAEQDSNRRWWLKVAIQACTENKSYPGEIYARPDVDHGLQARNGGDGQFTIADHAGAKCWEVYQKGHYLYFSVGDEFRRMAPVSVDIQVEYLDAGTEGIALDYDSSDSTAPFKGAYKNHSQSIHCLDTEKWRKTRFHLPNARFHGSQNLQADFRFCSGGDHMIIRSVRVWPSAPGE